MIPTPLKPWYKLRVNVRPIRRAYFVRQDDASQIEEAIRLCCTQWGGIRNLLVPVGADLSIGPLFIDLLKLHEPDLFVSYLGDLKTGNMTDHRELQR